MKIRNLFYLLFVLAVSALSFTSCIEIYEEPQVDPQQVLTDYLTVSNLDLPAVIASGVTTAAEVSKNVNAFYIIDVRAKADYDKGHITGAVNSTVADVLTAAAGAGTKPILVVCYTGQNAAYASVCLRLSGYPNSKIMKWGMSSWGPAFDRWTTNVSNQAINHANWSTTNTLKTPVTFNTPQWTSNNTDGAEILKERVRIALDKGLQSVKSADVLADPGKFFLVNYWTEADVALYGHIKGAYRINETLKLADPVGFKNLDPNAVVVPYCWTGQTSAMVSAYLTVLGYDAKSLMFGANGMIEEKLQKNRWKTEATTTNYPL